MAPRRTRQLTPEEKRLWGAIARLITPLRAPGPFPHGARPETAPVVSPAPPPAPVKRPKASPPGQKPVKLGDLGLKPQPACPHGPAPSPKPISPKPLSPLPPAPLGPGLERRERRGLQRGLLPIEARIDLHGLYQAEAHAALVGFLMRARAAGMARVLVVTGKGGADEHAMFSDRGVLRRSVPHWLRAAELRPVVLGFEEAARHHGGAGALYVRLKRR